MGGAFTAIADDSTALHWNPAGLSQIKRPEFFGALSHEKREAEMDYFGSVESTFVNKTRPNSFGVVLPVPVYQGGLAFAFSVNRVQSFDSRQWKKIPSSVSSSSKSYPANLVVSTHGTSAALWRSQRMFLWGER